MGVGDYSSSKKSDHALGSYLSQERGSGRLLVGYSSADREEQHAQSEVGATHDTVFSHYVPQYSISLTAEQEAIVQFSNWQTRDLLDNNFKKHKKL